MGIHFHRHRFNKNSSPTRPAATTRIFTQLKIAKALLYTAEKNHSPPRHSYRDHRSALPPAKKRISVQTFTLQTHQTHSQCAHASAGVGGTNTQKATSRAYTLENPESKFKRNYSLAFETQRVAPAARDSSGKEQQRARARIHRAQKEVAERERERERKIREERGRPSSLAKIKGRNKNSQFEPIIGILINRARSVNHAARHQTVSWGSRILRMERERERERGRE